MKSYNCGLKFLLLVIVYLSRIFLAGLKFAEASIFGSMNLFEDFCLVEIEFKFFAWSLVFWCDLFEDVRDFLCPEAWRIF